MVHLFDFVIIHSDDKMGVYQDSVCMFICSTINLSCLCSWKREFTLSGICACLQKLAYFASSVVHDHHLFACLRKHHLFLIVLYQSVPV